MTPANPMSTQINQARSNKTNRVQSMALSAGIRITPRFHPYPIEKKSILGRLKGKVWPRSDAVGPKGPKGRKGLAARPP